MKSDVLALLTVVFIFANSASGEEPLERTLALGPQQISEPWFKLRLKTDQAMLEDGDAVPILQRASWLPSAPALDKQRADARALLEGNFPDEPPDAEQVLWFFKEFERAARQEHCDWNFPIRSEGKLEMTLGMISEIAANLNALAGYAKYEIATGQTESALNRIRIGMGVIGQIRKSPIVVMKMMALKKANLFYDLLFEAVEDPNCPNLYWALTDLPPEFAAHRHLVDWHRRTDFLAIPHLIDLDYLPKDSPWGRIRQAIRVPKSFSSGGFAGYIVGEDTAIATNMKDAKAALASEFTEEEIEKMSADEITVRYFLKEYLRYCDLQTAAFLLPPHEAIAHLQRIEPRFAEMPKPLDEIIGVLDFVVLDAINLDRKRNALRCVELIRHELASDDALPKELGQLSFPAPQDPATNKGFAYACTKDGATLTAPEIQVSKWQKIEALKLTFRLQPAAETN